MQEKLSGVLIGIGAFVFLFGGWNSAYARGKIISGEIVVPSERG